MSAEAADQEDGLRLAGRTFAEIAHTLESGVDPVARMQRALALIQRLLQFDRGALFESGPAAKQLVTVPVLPPGEHAELEARLSGLLRLIADEDEEDREQRFRSDSPHRHLALPVIGLDRTIGILHVERADGPPFRLQDLRLLSIVAAQLGAYLTSLRLSEKDARQTRDLQVAHEFQQLLIGVVSHDLRNPLSAILNGVHLLHLTRRPDDPSVGTLKKIASSARRATQIINDLLDVTATRVAGKMLVAPHQTDLGALIGEVVEEVRLSHPGRSIEASGEKAAILGMWDGDRIGQVFANLLNNALQYSPRESAVRIDVTATEHEAVIAVGNDGPAIAASLLPALFEPFRRGGSGRKSGGGLGLGLYIVDQIVRAHGGSVAVRSAEATGTVFTVTLPRGS